MILGKRLRLRALERTDIPRCVTWLNDPEVRKNLLVYRPLSLAQEEDWYESMLKRPADEHVFCIEVQTPQGWTTIGNTGFHNLDWRNRSAEVGLFIGEKQFWGKGYGGDTLRLMLRYAFNQLNLNKVYLNVFSTNQRGIRCYEKIGFVHEGRMREDIYQDGQYIDVFIMSVLRSEWKDQEV